MHALCSPGVDADDVLSHTMQMNIYIYAADALPTAAGQANIYLRQLLMNDSTKAMQFDRLQNTWKYDMLLLLWGSPPYLPT